jgi:hypothetical protein
MLKIRNNIFLSVLALLIFFIVFFPKYTFASRAGIVIKKQDGTVKSSCVVFDDIYISGMELLQRSGFNPVVKGGFVVSVDGEGSKDSSQMLKDDLFWSYWKLNGSWAFQNIGANYSHVEDGGVEGWEFGRGNCSLPLITFEEICGQTDRDKSSAPADDITQDKNAVGEIGEESGSLSSEQVQSSQVNISDESANNRPALTPVEIIQSETKTDATVRGVSDRRFPSIFPEFNTGNVLILFSIFVVCGAVFVFIKVLLKKFVNSRRKK